MTRATDTFYVVVTTGKRPYALPYTAASTAAGARAAYFAITDRHVPASHRVVRVTATWEVK